MNIQILSRVLANRRARHALSHSTAATFVRALEDGANPNITLGLSDDPSLLLACVRNNWILGVQALIDHGADMEACTGFCRRTALFEAVVNGKRDMARVLLANGASMEGQGVDAQQGLKKLERYLGGGKKNDSSHMLENSTVRSVMEHRAKTQPLWQEILDEVQSGAIISPGPRSLAVSRAR